MTDIHRGAAHPALPGLPYSEYIFYLSGPMTGLPDYNYPEFERICKLLRTDGYKVLSPHENEPYGWLKGEPGYNEEARWLYYMNLDKKMVEESTAIILMRGWPYSSGSLAELGWSTQLKHDVFYFYDGSPYTIFPMTLEGHREATTFTTAK